MAGIARLRDFVQGMTRLADGGGGEAEFLAEGASLLRGLVAADDWLPPACAVVGPGYRQYLLHCDPAERFSVVSFVWGPGQRTPIHDHLVWGLVGQLRGEEISTEYVLGPPGTPPRPGRRDRLRPGEVAAVGAASYDIHVVENAVPDAPSISIHVYGGNIGAVRRHVFDPGTGEARAFVSGYGNDAVPNLWDRSAG
ncbi:cysteine dioxygenase family protein [Paracraurococcus ruber]|uniref:Cysteine dioxygenase n=1 Tax=Paracraurococcus ruber TaxID=77675 RepID=A0ABS1CT37_9PROT|nr:cysteine dioxygenase [Paracraurococcus ruber]MBK1657641.1 cysteine dioxygenase [Paracraurococcus ruber]TDG32172.1 cysteine dioxygenase [Paracraurococcus ruber]